MLGFAVNIKSQIDPVTNRKDLTTAETFPYKVTNDPTIARVLSRRSIQRLLSIECQHIVCISIYVNSDLYNLLTNIQDLLIPAQFLSMATGSSTELDHPFHMRFRLDGIFCTYSAIASIVRSNTNSREMAPTSHNRLISIP